MPEDAQTVTQALISLRGPLQNGRKPGIKMSRETRAHLTESVAQVDEALKANMQRTGVWGLEGSLELQPKRGGLRGLRGRHSLRNATFAQSTIDDERKEEGRWRRTQPA